MAEDDEQMRTMNIPAGLGEALLLTHELLLNASAPCEDADSALDDDMLRLIFTCCHPSFAAEVQVALTLRTVCGLTTAQVARAFLASEDAMAQRLLRAKQKIRLAGIPYEVPERDALEPRLRGVLALIYLVFTEGYAASSGKIVRPDLARERSGWRGCSTADAGTRRDQGGRRGCCWTIHAAPAARPQAAIWMQAVTGTVAVMRDVTKRFEEVRALKRRLAEAGGRS